MERKKRIRYNLSFLLLVILLLVLFFLNLVSGSVQMRPEEIINALVGRTGDGAVILWEIRIPRILAAFFLGGALSVSGFLLQTFFANPIAGPFVLGISSGAKLVVALVMILLLSRGISMNSLSMVLAAFVGSMICTGFVLMISGKVRNMSVLVICGVMIGYICSAITDFAVTFADDSNIVNLHNWSLGSFSGTTWDNVKVIVLIVIPALFFVVGMTKQINAYQMGATYAQSLGVNIRLFRTVLILLSSILSACVTAFAGPVSFVGVAVPHLMKSLFGTARPILMIPACFLGGAAFCLACDLIARTFFSPTELSISSVTAVLGAPIVIYVMLRQHRKEWDG